MYLDKWLGVYKSASDNTVGFMVKWDSVESKTPLPPDKWHHITVTLSDNTASIYLNGKLESKKKVNKSELYFPESSFRIGANVDGENSSTTYIDDLFILNDAASENEIIELVNSHEKAIKK